MIFDADLAELYGVTTKRLNQQVSRNADRFPDDFMFQPTEQELEILRLQFATSSLHGGRRYAARVFTEHGVLMAANVLRAPQASKASVFIVRASSNCGNFWPPITNLPPNWMNSNASFRIMTSSL